MSAAPEAKYPLPNDDYQIGWICALPIELAAGLVMLDKEHGVIESKDEQDTNSYHVGQIQEHNIVMACLPDGEYGTNAAAHVAANMLRSFKNLRFGVLVGIGGGLPDAKRGTPGFDLRLGDVVVSSAKSTTRGVIQYDLGRKVQSLGNEGDQSYMQQFVRKGLLNRPPLALRTALSSLQAKHLIGRTKVPQILQSLLKDTDLAETFAPPDPDQDRLYLASYAHQDATDYLGGCSGCDLDQIITRARRAKSWPRIFYGTILSGNCVIRDSTTRDQLKDAFASESALCVEMEAAGLMNSFECLVIRGICDYADSHKNDAWHNYAALTAAAFTKDLLSYLSTDQVKREDRLQLLQLVDVVREQLVPIRGYMNSQVDEKEKEKAEQELNKAEKEREKLETALQECHRQLHPGVSYQEAKNIVSIRAPGTCKWVFDDPKYLMWKDNKQGDLLWVSADPGCGKSVLARSLVDEVFTGMETFSVCYYFFKDTTGQDSLATALCSILHQLLTHQPHLRRYARGPYERFGQQLRQESDILWAILMAAAADSEVQPIICIIDALDEAAHASRGSLISNLCRFYQGMASIPPYKAHMRLKFLVTSRPYDTITDEFDRLSDSLPKIRLKGEYKNSEISQEINIVIKYKVAELARKCKLSPGARSRLEEKLLSMKHRTYLWLYLALDDIQRSFKQSVNPDLAKFDTLPKSVDDAYEKILQGTALEIRTTVKQILLLIVGARRAFTVTELCLAMEMLDNTQIDYFHMAENVRQWCGLFVFICDGKVFLIHQTAKDFLLRQPNDNIPRTNSWKRCIDLTAMEKTMAILCTKVIRTDEVRRKRHAQTDSVSARSLGNASSLLEYAVLFMLSHIAKSRASADDPMWESVLLVYDYLPTSRRSIWLSFNWTNRYPFSGCLHAPIYMAVYAEHISILNQRICTAGFGIDERNQYGDNPLVFAATNNKQQALTWLIDRGAAVDACNDHGFNALLVSSKHGHRKIMSILLARGASVNSNGSRSHPLIQAASLGNAECIRHLLANGADVNTWASYFGNALQCAAYYNESYAVELLLQSGADVNARGGVYDSALQATCYVACDQVVQILLSYKPRIFGEGRCGNALCAAIRAGQRQDVSDKVENIVAMLISYGVDPNTPMRCKSFIQGACLRRNRFLILWAFADDTLDINRSSSTLQQWYRNLSKADQDELQKSLADIGVRWFDNDVFAVVAAARHVRRDTTSALRAFLVKKLNCALTNPMSFYRGDDSYIQETVSASIGVGSISSIRSCDSCDSVEYNLRQYSQKTAPSPYNTSPQADVGSEHIYDHDVVHVDIPIPLEVLGATGNSSLQIACDTLQEGVVRILLRAGADVNFCPPYTKSPLQLASEKGPVNVIELLIAAGADLNFRGPAEQCPPLELASAHGSVESVGLLLDAGAELDTQATAMTGVVKCEALQAAAAAGHEEIVELLLRMDARVNAIGPKCGTALHGAVRQGSETIVMLLLQHGAVVDIPFNQTTPLQLACQQDWLEGFTALLVPSNDGGAKSDEHFALLRLALQCGASSIVEMLLDAGVFIDVNNEENPDLLEAAIQSGNEETVQLLLERGTEVNPTNSQNDSLLYLAASSCNPRILGMLLAAGAVVDAPVRYSHGNKAQYQGTALHEAICNNHVEAIKTLIAAGADINLKGDLGTATQTAKHYQRDELVTFFSNIEEARRHMNGAEHDDLLRSIERISGRLQHVKSVYSYLQDKQKPESIQTALNRAQFMYVPSEYVDEFTASDYEEDYAPSGSDGGWVSDDFDDESGVAGHGDDDDNSNDEYDEEIRT